MSTIRKLGEIIGYEVALFAPPHGYFALQTESEDLYERMCIEWPRIWNELNLWTAKDINFYINNSYHLHNLISYVEMETSHFSEEKLVVSLQICFIEDHFLMIELDIDTWKILHVYLDAVRTTKKLDETIVYEDMLLHAPPHGFFQLKRGSIEQLEKIDIEWSRIWSELVLWPAKDINNYINDPLYLQYHTSYLVIETSHFSEEELVVSLQICFTEDHYLMIELDIETWKILHVYLTT